MKIDIDLKMAGHLWKSMNSDTFSAHFGKNSI